ncbi:unnamed protein product [Mytilus edulis]|uniref:Uncharacterized protein n=1 Tax=Mytilus edulis TaxID=6550 RepID=A0A8S3RHD4_MYTED|nr:unnamed protein product [Mytilus edulis]
MNGLTTVYDGATILKANGSFGKSKTVTVNNFGGVTYVHLRSPKKDAAGWNTFTISLVEYRELVKMAGPSTVAAIAQNFDLQNRENRNQELAALEAATDDSQPPKRMDVYIESEGEGTSPSRRKRKVCKESDEEEVLEEKRTRRTVIIDSD